MGKYNRLCLAERKLLAKWKHEGRSNKESARLLHRHPSTIGRELKRNLYQGQLTSFYEPLHAQARSQERKHRVFAAKHPLKNAKIYAYVLEQLRQSWSPEQIAGRLKLKHPDDPSWQIHHETIYRFIYRKENQDKALWEYLRRKQKRRRSKQGRKSQRVRIPDRISIHQRPEKVDRREEFGHWEGDTVVGRGKDHGFHTTYERFSSFYRFALMGTLEAEASYEAQRRIYADYPETARKSTTLDNGLEHSQHKRLEKELGIKTFFADTYAAWQRGGNENANLWLRYYFPKGTDFRTIPAEELRAVEWELNNRPRKRLGFKTPQEVFGEKLKGCAS
jgi:IS30 family transposase